MDTTGKRVTRWANWRDDKLRDRRNFKVRRYSWHDKRAKISWYGRVHRGKEDSLLGRMPWC